MPQLNKEEDWTPPDYASPIDDNEEAWTPPKYAVEAKAEEAPKKSVFSKVKDFLTPADKLRPTLLQPKIKQSETIDKSNWDKRPDGTNKGDGFLGVFKLPDGRVSSEVSIADSEKLKDEKGDHIDYPTLVPTLTKEEIQQVLNVAHKGGPMPQNVKDKAEAYALKRKEQGLPLFATPGEERTDLYPELSRVPGYDPNKKPETQSFLSTVSDTAKQFLDEHPTIKAIGKRIIEGPEPGKYPIQGPGLMKIPGLEQATNYLSQKVTGSSGNLRLAAGATVKAIGDLLEGGFDPRTAGIQEVPPVESIPIRRPPVRQSEEIPYRMGSSTQEVPIREPSIVPPVDAPIEESKKPFVNPFEKPEASRVNIPDYVPVGEEDIFNSDRPKQGVDLEDKIYRNAQEKFNMGKDWTPPSYATEVKGEDIAQKEGKVPLYRWESEKGAGVPDWVKEDPKYKDSQKASGGWFTNDIKDIDFYKKDANGKGKLITKYVTPEEFESSKVSNNPEVLKHSASPETEHFFSNSQKEEWKPPSYVSEVPQEAKTTEGKLAIGADIKSLGKVLGTSLYKGDIAPIATKELLQNSIDAVRHLGTEGKIDVIFDKHKNIIHVSDNGKGLTKEELESVFTDLGSSGKRDDVNAAGGFGLAKAAPLLGGKKVEVSSITQDAKGIFHKYSFEGTPEQLLEGVDIKHKIVPPEGASTGTTVKVHVPENSDYYSAGQFIDKLSKHSPNIQSKIRVGRNMALDKYNPENILKHVNKGEGKSIATLEGPSATTELIIPKSATSGTRSYLEMHLSNNGMYQGTKVKYFNGEIPGLPSELTVDIRSKVPEGHPDYPFTANREEVRGSVDKQISDYIEENIVKPGVGKRLDELKTLYHSMPEITVGKGEFPNTFGRKISIYDPKGQITPAEMKGITENSSFQTLANNIASTLDEAMKVAGTPEWRDRLEKVGIIFDQKLHGIHIPNPGSGKSAILVNPFISIDRMSPDEASANILHTILHEMAHVEVSGPGHNEAFTIRLGDIYAKFGARRSVEAQDQILNSIADPNTGIYNPEIQEILSTYKKSRGREGTTEDLLSGTGIGSRSKGRGKDNLPKSDTSDAEGTTSAVSKLIDSLKEAKGLSQEQQIINKTERARRFASFAGVKQEGVEGAKKSLGKLRGEFEKVNPGEGLELNQKETDSLFTAIKRAKITEGEKARGYTALFKLLSGESVPQRNELALLDDVFGHGFADQITEMHGGIGLVGVKIGKLANTMKAMMYSSDLSFGLRQGIGMVHKAEWRNAVVEQFKYLAKPEYFHAAMEAIQEHPKYLAARESGLFIAKPGGLLNGEEAFMDNYVTDLPKGVASLYTRDIVDASERAYVGGLNKLRMDLYDNLTTLAKSLGHEPFATRQIKENGKFALDDAGKVKTTTVPTEISENIAKYINVFTGRGNLGELERIKGTMNFIFGSPRMLSSRLTVLNPKFYMDLDHFTRKEAVKSLLAVAAASTTLNTLGALAGGKVGLDILSSDFMKTRFASGNVIDPSGSFQQPIVAAARMIGELNRMASGKKLKSGERNIPQIAGDFLANKLSPFTGLAYELASANRFTGGGNYVDRFGNQKNVMSEAGKRFISIFSQDMWNLLSNDPSFAEAVGIPPLMLLGVGEQNYPERKTSKFRKMKLR